MVNGILLMVNRLLLILLFIPLLSFSQTLEERLEKTFKYSTFYAAVNGGTSLSDENVFSVTTGQLNQNVVETPYDYSVSLGVRKIARFSYENRANTFYDGTEKSFSDAATIGKIKGFEFLFEADYRRQEGVNYLDQNHFLRYVGDKWIFKGEYLQNGFADIEYFETSQRYRFSYDNFPLFDKISEYLPNSKLSFNIGSLQRLSEPYGYEPLDEWMLDNGNLHYTYLAIQEGYNVDVYNNEYTNPDGEVVATSAEVWEEIVIPQVLSEYISKKRNELEKKVLQSLVVGFDFYHYKKNFWLHSWGNLIPYHYDDGGRYSYHNYNENKQWYDYSGGIIFGYKFNKQFGIFAEGKYNKYWNREWYDFKCGINYVIL